MKLINRALLVLGALLLAVSPLQAQSLSAARAGIVAPPFDVTRDATGGDSRGKHIVIGVGVGAVAGGIIGGLSARGGQTGSSLDGIATGASVAVGALLGALIGGLIGAVWP